MAEDATSASVEVISKLLMESFNGPFETIAAELEKLECALKREIWRSLRTFSSLPQEQSWTNHGLPLRQSQLGWLSRIDVENSKFLQTDQALKEAIVLVRDRLFICLQCSIHLLTIDICCFNSCNKSQDTQQSCKA